MPTPFVVREQVPSFRNDFLAWSADAVVVRGLVE
jgi:hypothetical protein